MPTARFCCILLAGEQSRNGGKHAHSTGGREYRCPARDHWLVGAEVSEKARYHVKACRSRRWCGVGIGDRGGAWLARRLACPIRQHAIFRRARNPGRGFYGIGLVQSPSATLASLHCVGGITAERSLADATAPPDRGPGVGHCTGPAAGWPDPRPGDNPGQLAEGGRLSALYHALRRLVSCLKDLGGLGDLPGHCGGRRLGLLALCRIGRPRKPALRSQF